MALSSATRRSSSRPTSRRSSQLASSAGSSGMVATNRVIAGSFHAFGQASGRLVEDLVSDGLRDAEGGADVVIAFAAGASADDGAFALVEAGEATFELFVDL